MDKVLWFDAETTGLDAERQDIIQIAGLIEIDGHVKEEFNLACAPHSPDNVSPEALEINHHTLEEIQAWPDPTKTAREFCSMLDKWVDKHDRTDKMTPGGHNVRFDIEFLDRWIKKGGSKYGSGSYLTWQPIDTMYLAVAARHVGRIHPINMKLEEVAKSLNVEPGTHDAMADIKATREVGEQLLKMMSEGA